MHLIDKSVNFQGSVPILGSSISIASGMAMSKNWKKFYCCCFYRRWFRRRGIILRNSKYGRSTIYLC